MAVTVSRDEFASAVRLHQAGDLAAAASLYESILGRDATHADAFHLLGLARYQQGQPWLAVDLIGRAVALHPAVPVFRATLGEVYRALGHFEKAVSLCREALELGLNDPAVQNNLGLALHALGRPAEAAAAFRAVLIQWPNDAPAHTNLGAALRALKSNDEALGHLRRAVALNPNLAAAQSNLGQILLDLGRPSEALPHCREAVNLEPNLPEAHNNLGNAHRALSRTAEALECYREALRLNPSLAQAHVNVGLALQQDEHWDEALPWFRRACELEPNSLVFIAVLAEAAVEREGFEEATACYQRMLSIDSGLAATHNALGWLLQEDGRLEEAGEHLRRSLELRPEHTIAHVNLGGIHEKLGDFASAETCFRAALSDEQSAGQALARLAVLLGGKLPDADRERIEERLASSDENDPARPNMLFGLASVCDAQKRFSRAAQCAREANRLTKAQLARRKIAYDPSEHERLVSDLMEAVDGAYFARLAGAGLETRRPIFVVGLPRSGTSLIEQILASHSQCHGAGELPLARQDFRALPELLNREDPPLLSIGHLTRDAVRRLATWHEQRLNEIDDGFSPRIVDKMPDNYLHLGLLACLFPRAVLIHCRRDLRDVAVSCWITGFRSIRWTNDFHHIASRFGQHGRLMTHWRTVLPVPVHEVDYEQTVADPEGTARTLLTACELDWEPACLDFHRTRRPVRTASFTQVRQPVYQSSIGRWKNYEHELADLFACLPSDSDCSNS
jgi:tetratricopeptide (TPR) repeat protein